MSDKDESSSFSPKVTVVGINFGETEGDWEETSLSLLGRRDAPISFVDRSCFARQASFVKTPLSDFVGERRAPPFDLVVTEKKLLFLILLIPHLQSREKQLFLS